MEFQPVLRQKAFLSVVAQLREAIERGDYVPGEMLPSERELCRRMEVSRPVMREAMSALQLLGIVRTRAGLGSFVSETVDGPAGWGPPLEVSAADIMEARQIMEPAGARLAASRLTAEAARGMDELLTEMREAVHDADGGRFVGLELRFHQAVADASGNEVIRRLVATVVRHSYRQLRRTGEDGGSGYSPRLGRLYLEHHESIQAHLVRGAGDQAAQGMFRHLLAVQATQSAEGKEDAWEQARAAILGGLPEQAGRLGRPV